MITERLSADSEGLRRAAEILANGGIVGMPTETVYGLAANAYNKEAVRKVFEAKGRPQDNPLIVHISNFSMLNDIVIKMPRFAAECAEKFWPGPFTMVLPRGEKIPPEISAGLDTVAVRFPVNKTAAALISECGFPLAAPSANTSGKPSPVTAQHVLDDLDGKIDAVIMGEQCKVGVESTVITLCTDIPRLLRPGEITPEEIKSVTGELIIDKAVLSKPEEGKAVASPGMKYKHYSPKAKIIMIEAESETFCDYVNQKDAYALCFKEDEAKLRVPYICYGASSDDESQAAGLFAALRELDDKGCKLCFARAPKREGVGLAVFNRLIRAAAFEVINL